MDLNLKENFTAKWTKYFNGAELPIAFYYSDQEMGIEAAKPPSGHQCIIGLLARVRRGTPLRFGAMNIGCFGGKRYLGFSQEVMPNFEYFLSCGIPGKLEGGRYKKTPELVLEVMKKIPQFTAPAKYIVFKRWDALQKGDDPAAVIFFAPADVLSGLFTLANYDELEPAVYSPFSAGCGSIVQYPYLERQESRPRAILGMFDVSARPFVPENTLSFAIPMNKFTRMVDNMDESFLQTGSWEKVKSRLGGG